MTDYYDVMKYELTECQKEKIWNLMLKRGFKNIEVYIDIMLANQFNRLDRKRISPKRSIKTY